MGLDHLIAAFPFNCMIIALQCWVAFCYRTMEIGHNCTYISFLTLPPLPPSYTSRYRKCQAGLPVLYIILLLAIYFTHDSIYMTLLQFRGCCLFNLGSYIPTEAGRQEN